MVQRFTKILMMLSLILIGLQSQAQIVYYYEDFADGIPSTWKTYDIDNKTPRIATTPSFKGNGWIGINGSALSTSWYNPASAANDWMVTESLAIPAASDPNNRVLLVWYEQASNVTYPDGYEVYIGTTDQTVASFTNKIVTVLPAQTSAAGGFKSFDLTAYAGQSIFVAFRNNTNDGEILFIDDVAVAEYGPRNMVPTDINNLVYNPVGNITIKGTMANRGWETVTNFKFNYSIDGGPAQTSTATGNLKTFVSSQFSSTIPYAGTQGKHTLSLWADQVNNDTTIVAEDSLSLDFYVYDATQATGRTPLIETFSSSTCPPCKQGNETLAAAVAAAPEKPILLKIQQDFPGTGDPYRTTETVSRRGYYGINSIPDTRLDGNTWVGNTNSITTTIINNSFSRPGLANINADYSIDVANQSVSITGSLTPTVDLISGCFFNVAILEGQTDNNIKTNGETVFKHIIKKFYPDENGLFADGVPEGEKIDFEYLYTFPGKYRLPSDGLVANIINLDTEHSVEEFEDLEVVVWLENRRDQFVMNSAEAAEGTSTKNELTLEVFSLFPNPTTDLATMKIGLKDALEGTIQISDMSGRILTNKVLNLSAGTHLIQLPEVSTLAPGQYIISYRSGQKIAVQELIVQ